MSSEWTIALIGAVAAVLSCAMSLPQVRQIVKTGTCAGVAAGTWAIVVANGTLWLVYAVLTGAYMAGVPSLINVPMALYVLLRIHRERRTRSGTALCEGPVAGTDPVQIP